MWCSSRPWPGEPEAAGAHIPAVSSLAEPGPVSRTLSLRFPRGPLGAQEAHTTSWGAAWGHGNSPG